MTPAAFPSSYVGETNVVAKVIDSTINRTPCITLAKHVEINSLCFPSIPGDYPLSNGHLGLFKMQLSVNVKI
jgi:hypothetical protein